MYRHALADGSALVKFGNYKSEHGLEMALPLLRSIHFRWVEGTVNAIGDMMSSSIYSKRAINMMRGLGVKFDWEEELSIEETQAIFVGIKRVIEHGYEVGIFFLIGHKNIPIVTQKFKEAWEAAGLLGAQFEAIS